MKLKSDDFDIDLLETTKRRRFFGRPGWYWQEIRLPPKGPFASLGDVLRDLTHAVENGALAEALRAHSEASNAPRGGQITQAEESDHDTKFAAGGSLAGKLGVGARSQGSSPGLVRRRI